ncbi:hypothetical protein H632_c786p1 [Helicosporidium sp. ATCC 50920]|nr:hypothetical protein H632_c786p1 [Helicosporidium sp. ATCC 50920]|eukprot:KDD75249.1 hypothetical protein H632_c786p1 [Helicosporidium sp. ATCC 50920]
MVGLWNMEVHACDLGLPCTPDQLKKDKLSLIPTTGKTVGQTVPAAAKAYVSRFNVICPATKKLAEMKTIRMSKACMKVGNDALYRYIVTGYYWCGKAIMNRTFYVEAGVTRGGRYKIKNVGKQRVV